MMIVVGKRDMVSRLPNDDQSENNKLNSKETNTSQSVWEHAL
jgi:hypothetical protein